MLKFFPQIIIALCGISYAGIYIVGIKNGTVKPILATRVFLLFALVLSFLTNYSQTGVHGLMANTLNIVNALAVFATFFATLLNKDTRKKFTGFETICLFAVVLIFLMWIISKQNILANILVQIILVVAYLPTIIHLWKSPRNTESLGAWSLDLVASFFGMIEPLRTIDLLPIIYGIRSIVSTIIVIFLILRLKLREIKLGKK